MAQFVNQARAAELCVRFPHVPITQVAERQGSGKLTLNKSGSSGTRIWQVPWFFYPAFCDWLLGRTAVNPFGRPQIFRPDVFSPCYPWLYCTEASVEGEDLLGVDASLRAFYRRAIVTAKYQPLELNNSIHINSQMLTIPNTQFIFIGQNPTNLAGFQQVFGVEIVGRANGGTFVLGFADDTSASSFLVPAIGGAGAGAVVGGEPVPTSNPTVEPVKTPPIKFNASSVAVRDAVRTALGLTAAEKPGAVVVNGPEAAVGASGPWIITLNVPEIKIITAPSGAGDNKLEYASAGITLAAAGENGVTDIPFVPGITGGTVGAPAATTLTPDAWWDNPGVSTDPTEFATASSLYRLQWSGKVVAGAFRFKAVFADGTTNYSNEINPNTAQPTDLRLALYSLLEEATRLPDGKKNKQMSDDGNAYPHVGVRLNFNRAYVSNPYLDGAMIRPNISEDGDPRKTYKAIREYATDNPRRPVLFYFGLQNCTSRATAITLEWAGIGAGGAGGIEKPSIKLTKYDPYLANRLDQNVGKVVPLGEITFQRHQVIAVDMIYLLNVVGSVNMFTFQGFPPWTLLLSGIEAKQTRLPNGQPCFDMTFKFAFNPYTHQAIFRPLYMRWEFVRGVLVGRFPKETIATPTNPLDRVSSRARINPRAAERAFAAPKAPREVPLVIDPRTGKPVAGGPGGVVGGAPGAGPGGVELVVPPPMFETFGAASEAVGAGIVIPVPDQLMNLGGGYNADNPNPNPSPNSGLGAQQNGQVAVPFGQQPATNNEGALANVIAQLSAPLEEDPNSTTYRAADNWESQSNVLGDMIAKSIGCGEGSANDDQRAAASGIEEDIEQGRLDGAPWIESLTAVTITGTEGGTGNLEFDLALARNAHECGAKLAPATRAFLGLPPEPEDVATGGPLCGTPPGAAGANLGAAPGALVVAPAGGAVGANDPSKAANVGGANSVQLMKVYDLGLIYPICDHTPILWMQ